MSARRVFTHQVPDTADLEASHAFHGDAYNRRREVALTKDHGDRSFYNQHGVELRWSVSFKSFEWLDLTATQRCLLQALTVRMEYDRPGHPFLVGNAELCRAASIKCPKTLAKHLDALYTHGFIGYSRDQDGNGKTSYRILWRNIISAADEAHREWAARFKSTPLIPQIHEDAPDVPSIVEPQEASQEPVPSRRRNIDLSPTQEALDSYLSKRAS